MSIDSKKILGDTSSEYHERTGTNPSDYIAEGVHYNTGNSKDLLKEFSNKVPDNTEIVVNYRVFGNYFRTHASGTALIPKIKN